MYSINNLTMKKIFVSALVALCGLTASYAQQASFLSNNHCLYRISQESQNQKCLLLPVQEDAEMANIKVIADNKQVKAFNVKLAKDHVDYFVPLYMDEFAGLKGLALDIHVNGDYNKEGLNALTCWKEMKFSDTFDMKNREQYRQDFHHTPAYGWMNDPNGMFYKDGVWNLYFQYNPYGSQWENMTWGHSTSTDLVHWKFQGTPIQPDAVGTIFSGSAVVDKNNTAGLGKGVVVALYTSAGENQTQSMAYSTDNGKTFTKYEGNPIITSNVPDFRDPHMFWNEDIKKWNMIMAVGQHMEIYSSDNLKDWKYESSFGEKYGNHGGVWECPDLMKMKVRGTGKEKWMLICNINPGGPSGGSATQYFIGDFDGHKFTCDSKPEVTKWMDYGKDHYATVTFDNAPEGRRVAIAWMSNWQYANLTPFKQNRGANGLPRELKLYEKNGKYYISEDVAPEVYALRKDTKNLADASVADAKEFAGVAANMNGAFEIEADVTPDANGIAGIEISNNKRERTLIYFDMKQGKVVMDRTESGLSDFGKQAVPHDIELAWDKQLAAEGKQPARIANSINYKNDFALATWAPLSLCEDGKKTYHVDIFVDKSSVELFVDGGRIAMTNLVFPVAPYENVKLYTQGGKAEFKNLKVHKLGL